MTNNTTALPPQKKKSHCTCPTKTDVGWCTKCSKIKMVFALKHGMEMYKLKNPDGSLTNPVRYSFYKMNHIDSSKIVAGMIRRFRDSVLFKHASNKILFYENGNLIGKYTP